MANKLAKVDAEAMNSLYASELTKTGIKTAADDKGIINAPQAFEDHQSYLETLKSVMAEDSRSDFNENDPIQD
jgi:hypothetical protein